MDPPNNSGGCHPALGLPLGSGSCIWLYSLEGIHLHLSASFTQPKIMPADTLQLPSDPFIEIEAAEWWLERNTVFPGTLQGRIALR
jgi:hypothetical protein